MTPTPPRRAPPGAEDGEYAPAPDLVLGRQGTQRIVTRGLSLEPLRSADLRLTSAHRRRAQNVRQGEGCQARQIGTSGVLAKPRCRSFFGTAGPSSGDVPRLEGEGLAREVPLRGVAVVPAADERVSFEEDIKPLFRPTDLESMAWAFDLSSYDEVKDHGAAILERLREGSMPCDTEGPRSRSSCSSVGPRPECSSSGRPTAGCLRGGAHLAHEDLTA